MDTDTLSPAELRAMLDDLSLTPDARASIERLLAVTLAVERNKRLPEAKQRTTAGGLGDEEAR